MTKENTERVLGIEELTWRKQAACVGKQEFFFNDFKGSLVREAKKICGQCPVKAQCLEYGLTHIEYGIWGGYTANERKRMRRVRRETLRAVE
jgi:WhiB family redox-sensing transcriptional regulator